MREILLAVVFLTIPINARLAQRPGQSAEPPVKPELTAHILSAETHKGHHVSSVYNSSTGQYSHGVGTSVERDTEIQIGNLVYESSEIHKEVQVGKDYPVKIETDI